MDNHYTPVVNYCTLARRSSGHMSVAPAVLQEPGHKFRHRCVVEYTPPLVPGTRDPGSVPRNLYHDLALLPEHKKELKLNWNERVMRLRLVS